MNKIVVSFIIGACCVIDARSEVPVAGSSSDAPFYRVWRGYRKPGMSRDAFLTELQVFARGTHQWLRRRVSHGRAYFPVATPNTAPLGLPDELALVEYESDAAYRVARETPVGRVYQDTHWVLFDRPGPGSKTKSGGPVRFEWSVVTDQPYDVFGRRIDWQKGHTRFTLGTIRSGATTDQIAAHVSRMRKELGPRGLDGMVFVADANGFLASWCHWQSKTRATRALGSPVGSALHEAMLKFTEPVQSVAARVYRGSLRAGELVNVLFRVR